MIKAETCEKRTNAESEKFHREYNKPGKHFIFIDDAPNWEGIFAFPLEEYLEGIVRKNIAAKKRNAMSIQFKALMEGGELTVRYKLRKDNNDDFLYIDRISLSARVDFKFYEMTTNDSVMTEMRRCYIEASKSVPVEIMESAAAALRALREDWPAGFFAGLAPTLECGACSRKLNDMVSKIIGLGPDCANKFNIHHGHELARRIEALRNKKAAEKTIDEDGG